MKLKSNLQKLKTGAVSAHEYIRRMKEFAYALVASGVSVTEEELLNCMINGLAPEFSTEKVMHKC